MLYLLNALSLTIAIETTEKATKMLHICCWLIALRYICCIRMCDSAFMQTALADHINAYHTDLTARYGV